MKKVFALLLAFIFLCPTTLAFASKVATPVHGEKVMDIIVNDDIGFVLYRSTDAETEAEAVSPLSGKELPSQSLMSTKYYTSDQYEGYFYIISTGQKISDHTFKAYFSYDYTMASCYDTENKIIMDSGYTGNLRPKAEGEGRENLTPTQVYGYITFVLYDGDNVSSEVHLKIYCNQDGDTWVSRRG